MVELRELVSSSILIVVLFIGALVLGYVLNDNQDLRRKLVELAAENAGLRQQVAALLDVLFKYFSIERSTTSNEDRWREVTALLQDIQKVRQQGVSFNINAGSSTIGGDSNSISAEPGAQIGQAAAGRNISQESGKS